MLNLTLAVLTCFCVRARRACASTRPPATGLKSDGKHIKRQDTHTSLNLQDIFSLHTGVKKSSQRAGYRHAMHMHMHMCMCMYHTTSDRAGPDRAPLQGRAAAARYSAMC